MVNFSISAQNWAFWFFFHTKFHKESWHVPLSGNESRRNEFKLPGMCQGRTLQGNWRNLFPFFHPRRHLLIPKEMKSSPKIFPGWEVNQGKKNQSIFLDKTQDELFTAGPLGNEGRARCIGKNLNIMNIDDTSITRSSPLDRASRAVHYYYFYRGRAPPPPSPLRTSRRFFLSSFFRGEFVR